MKKITTNLSTILFSLTLSACATTQNISPENKSSISHVAIDKNVNVKGQMYYVGPGFGYVGLLSMIPSASAENKIEHLVSSNNISIKNIVAEELTKGLHNIPRLKLVNEKKADATFKVNVLSYGFSIPQGFSFEVVPIMTLDMQLIKNNKVVWENTSRVLPLFNGMKSYKVSEIETNPTAVNNAWHAAAEKAVGKALLTLN